MEITKEITVKLSIKDLKNLNDCSFTSFGVIGFIF